MRSMTGFAQSRLDFNDLFLGISFKSFNHRFLEINFKGTGITPQFEKMIRDIVRDRVHRGKLEIVFNLFDYSQKRFNLQFNEELLTGIMQKLLPLKEKFGPEVEISLDYLLKIPMIFHLEYCSDAFSAEEGQRIKDFVESIFIDFLNTRQEEGEYLIKDCLEQIEKLDKSVEIVQESAGLIEQDLYRKYRERIEKILQDHEIDEKRLLQEAAILAEKICIHEEINRLQTHSKRLKELLQDENLAVKGKEADFLSQEMQRETHTIASKTDSLDINRHILDIRRAIEKIKQQVQNLE